LKKFLPLILLALTACGKPAVPSKTKAPVQLPPITQTFTAHHGCLVPGRSNPKTHSKVTGSITGWELSADAPNNVSMRIEKNGALVCLPAMTGVMTSNGNIAALPVAVGDEIKFSVTRAVNVKQIKVALRVEGD
jgi:hypothetical protein